MAWTNSRDGNYEIYFTTLDASGNKTSPEIRVTDALGSSWSPSLVWTGTVYGLASDDERDGNPEIYFTRIDCSCSDTDADLDGISECDGDCDDTNGSTYPGAPESNDGLDNQCPGDEGYGIVDELSGVCAFRNPSSEAEFSWVEQQNATSYEVVRSSLPDLSGDCTSIARTEVYWSDTEKPAEGVCFYYLVRALTPHLGSWGQNSAVGERTGVCP